MFFLKFCVQLWFDFFNEIILYVNELTTQNLLIQKRET